MEDAAQIKRCEKCGRSAHGGRCEPTRPIVVFATYGAKGHGGVKSTPQQ